MDFSVTGSSGQITYDLNGNLLTMLQKGIVHVSNTPLTVDDLHYTYASFSNQLLGQVACAGSQSVSMLNVLNTLQAIVQVVGIASNILDAAGKAGDIVNWATLLSQINGKLATEEVG